MSIVANMKKVGLTALALATAVGCASAPPPPPPVVAAPPKPKELTAEERLAKANEAFNNGDYTAAIADYDKVLGKEPKNGTALYNKAVALHRSGDFKGAQSAYQAALEANPNDLEAALNLGAVKKEVGDNEGAIKLYVEVLKKDEFNTKVLNNLATLYRAAGQYDQAIKTLRKLLMRDKNNVNAYKNLALVYFDQKKFKLTQTILDNALRMAKEQNLTEPDIYVNLGRVFLATNENGRAMAAFKKAVALKPDHVVANYNIGALALGHRDYQMAAKAYEVCSKAWPERYDVWASLGYAQQGLQDFAKAEKNLAKSRTLLLNQAKLVAQGPLKTKLAKEDEQMLLQLVRTAQNAEQLDKALGYAEEYLKLKGMTCSDEDYDGFCGRFNGIKLTIQMAKEAAQAPQEPAPTEEKKAMDAEDAQFFTEGGEEGAEGEAPAPGEEAAEAPQGPQGDNPEGAAGPEGELPPK